MGFAARKAVSGLEEADVSAARSVEHHIAASVEREMLGKVALPAAAEGAVLPRVLGVVGARQAQLRKAEVRRVIVLRAEEEVAGGKVLR